MKRALFIAHTPLFPTTGGDRIRMSQQLEMLCDNYDVDIVYLCRDASTPSVRDFNPKISGEWRFPIGTVQTYLQASRTLFNDLPEAVNHFHNSRMQLFIDSILPNYDLALAASVGSAVYLLRQHERAPHTRRLLDITDSLTMNYENAAECSKGLKKIFFSREAERMRRFEKLCRRDFDRIAYISERDRQFLSEEIDKTMIVGNWVDIPERTNKPVSTASKSGKENVIVFVGKMDYEPNITATDFFARKVMPLLRTGGCDVRFRIVGAKPTKEVRALEKIEGVEVTGFVESLLPYWQDATLVVAPMLSGSGIQNKVLQAMSNGCCVVTTPIGSEGIESLADGYVLADPKPEIFAETILHLLSNPDKRIQTGNAARLLVDSNLSRQHIATQFERFIRP